jgi:hypothetical protein
VLYTQNLVVLIRAKVSRDMLTDSVDVHLSPADFVNANPGSFYNAYFDFSAIRIYT